MNKYDLADEFCDVPTSHEHGAYISYFDTALWVCQHLVSQEGATTEDQEKLLTEAERRICHHCEAGNLEAHGLRAELGIIQNAPSTIPAHVWPRLAIDPILGQPQDDHEKHGGREYGEASWRNPMDAGRPGDVAWTALYFSKADVLRLWPASGEANPDILDKERPVATDERRSKGSPALDLARRALQDLYDGQPPDDVVLPNKVLFKEVNSWLSNRPEGKTRRKISNDTILRAACRRK